MGKETLTEQNIEALADRIDEMTAEAYFDSLSDEEVAENSHLFKRLINHSNPDPGWVGFSALMGRLELTMSAAHAELAQGTDLALQLLMVLTGAQDKMQLLEYGERIRALESKVPSIFRELIAGYVGGQAAGQQSAAWPPGFPTGAAPLPNPNTPAPAFTAYEWNTQAKTIPARQPQKHAAITLSAGGAMLGFVGESAIGVAVDVDINAKIVKVAYNGQKIDSLPAAFMVGLSIGDELIAVNASINGRHLVTMSEAVTGGYAPGQPVRVVAKVLQNSAGERSIIVVDQATQPLPVI